MNTDIQNKTTASEANSPQPTTNEEILSLLRKLVEQNETDKTNASDKTEPSHGKDQDDNTAEIKRLLAELLKKQTNNAPATETVDNDLDVHSFPTRRSSDRIGRASCRERVY